MRCSVKQTNQVKASTPPLWSARNANKLHTICWRACALDRQQQTSSHSHLLYNSIMLCAYLRARTCVYKYTIYTPCVCAHEQCAAVKPNATSSRLGTIGLSPSVSNAHNSESESANGNLRRLSLFMCSTYFHFRSKNTCTDFVCIGANKIRHFHCPSQRLSRLCLCRPSAHVQHMLLVYSDAVETCDAVCLGCTVVHHGQDWCKETRMQRSNQQPAFTSFSISRVLYLLTAVQLSRAASCAYLKSGS